jgi:glycosyltransferase involved in cell wall biosynthesis
LPEDKLAKAVSAAYAVMFLTSYAGFSFPMLEAMQCEVPVITSGKSGTPEVGGNAALYADPSNPEEIAAQMKLIFKDEQLRGKLIDNGRIQAGNFSWERTTELVWKSIQQAISE